MSVSFFAIALPLLLTSYFYTVRSFDRLECEYTSRYASLFRSELSRKLVDLEARAGHLGEKKVPGLILEGGRKNIDLSLTPEIFNQLHANLFLLFDDQGRAVYEQGFDLANHKKIPLSPGALEQLQAGRVFETAYNAVDPVTGLLALPEGQMIFAAHPVWSGDRKQRPLGVVVLGSLVDAGMPKMGSPMELGHELVLTPLLALDPAHQAILRRLVWGDSIEVSALSPDALAAHGLIRNREGRAVFLLELRVKRDIYRFGRRSTAVSMVWLSVIWLCGAALVWFLLRIFITSPLARLSGRVAEIARQGDFSLRIAPASDDEFGALSRDINKLLEAVEQARRRQSESEGRFKTAFDNSGVGVALVDLDGKLQDVNANCAAMLGFSVAEMIGMNHLELTHPDDLDIFQKLRQNILAGEEDHYWFEKRYKCKDGRFIWCMLSVSLQRDEQGRPMRSILHIQNIDERKRSEEEARRLGTRLDNLRRLESLGTLAGGIAHDFNNLLMGIMGNAVLARQVMNGESLIGGYLKNIEKCASDGADLTRQLLGFARQGQYEVKPINLNEIVNESVKMVGRTRKDVVFECALEPELWIVQADPGQMKQVLVNLYVNAVQAMPEGGRLTVSTGNIAFNREHLPPHGLPFGQYIELTVADTGVGMDKATMARIFEPFFTTKGMGRGTGLGLASVYGIVKNHRGAVDVFSEPGRGARFVIYLPAGQSVGLPMVQVQESVVTGRENVLIVDDEPCVAQVASEMVAMLGYNVMTAGDGWQAVDLFRRNGASLVLLDMIMPGVSGGEIFDRLRKIDPEVKVLLASGYSLDDQARRIMERGCSGFIQKPFDLKRLSHKIREVLDGPVSPLQ